MSEFKCPKCGGVDYYFSNRNVMKGIGGIWGNRGGVKKFPVCRVCEEIMDPNLETTPVTVMPVVSLSVNSLRVGIGLLVLALLLVGIFFGLEIWS